MEELTIIIRENLGYTPEVIGYLASIKEFEYSYKHYCLRHPCGIFNLSINYVLNDFLELLKELGEHQSNFDKNKEIRLSKKFSQLINDFFKFYDSCFEIIQACCKQHPPFKKEFLWKWLQRFNYETGKNFFNKLNSDLEHYRKIYNKLKHSINAIQPIYFYKDEISVMGYYLQSVASDGSIGPDEEIHPKHQNTHSASSYNFNLRKLYYLVYKISLVLQEVIITHFEQVYETNLDFNQNYKSDDKLWKELHERVTGLPYIFFPNEFNQNIPEVKINDNNLTFKIKKAKSTNLDDYRIRLIESGDGFSRSFRMPFY
jgi:hypothetical protein